MTPLFRCLFAAVLALLGLAAALSAFADTEREELRQIDTEAWEEQKAARGLYEERRLQAAFVRLERLEAALDRVEALSLAQRPDDLTEEEFGQYVGALAYGTLHTRRRSLADIYIAHGCYQRATAVAASQLSLVRQLPEFEVSPVYAQFLVRLRNAAEGLGEFEKAIEYQDLILAYSRRTPRGKRHVPSSLMRQASLHKQFGNSNEALDLLAKSRARYEDQWRDDPPTNRVRRTLNVKFLLIEGRYHEAKALLEEIIASEREQETPSDLRIAWASLHLADLYDALGQSHEEIAALQIALQHRIAAKQLEFLQVVKVARQLATALRKAGRMGEANALREKYHLCFD